MLRAMIEERKRYATKESEFGEGWLLCEKCGSHYRVTYGHSRRDCKESCEFKRISASDVKAIERWERKVQKRLTRESPLLYCEICDKQWRGYGHSHAHPGGEVFYSAYRVLERPWWKRLLMSTWLSLSHGPIVGTWKYRQWALAKDPAQEVGQ